MSDPRPVVSGVIYREIDGQYVRIEYAERFAGHDTDPQNIRVYDQFTEEEIFDRLLVGEQEEVIDAVIFDILEENT